MNNRKYILFFGILIFSGKLFSQKIAYNELIGSWKWGSGKYYVILTFKSDTIYSQHSIFLENKWSYVLDSTNNEYFLKTLPVDSKIIPCTYYKLKQVNQGSFTLQNYKIRAYNTKTNDWFEFEPQDHSIQSLTRITNN
jgi:hypothetical protein